MRYCTTHWSEDSYNVWMWHFQTQLHSVQNHFSSLRLISVPTPRYAQSLTRKVASHLTCVGTSYCSRSAQHFHSRIHVHMIATVCGQSVKTHHAQSQVLVIVTSVGLLYAVWCVGSPRHGSSHLCIKILCFCSTKLSRLQSVTVRLLCWKTTLRKRSFRADLVQCDCVCSGYFPIEQWCIASAQLLPITQG